ncbi:MAG: DUF1800 family protein [Acidimicrobiia bacterium]
MADDALIAHLLRRTGFGPVPGQVEALVPGGVAAAVDGVLSAPPPPLGDPPELASNQPNDMQRWWMLRMGQADIGLHEKMTWFWHGHITSAYKKVADTRLLWTQHLLLREQALGNFRTLLQAATIDPAMLSFLDGAGSQHQDPNENYARELQELFSIGRSRVKEANVRAGAKALAGWFIDADAGTAYFDKNFAMPGTKSVTFLGEPVNRAREVVDAVCDKMVARPEKFGTYLVGRLHRYFVGTEPDPARAEQLAVLFAQNDLSVAPVVEELIRHESFLADGTRLNRPRFPVEWVGAAFGVFGLTQPSQRRQATRDLAQLPFDPPNVAGWPPGPRWLDGTFSLIRARVARAAAQHQGVDPALLETIGEDPDPVGAALARCSTYEVSDETHGALTTAAGAVADPVERGRVLLALVVTSPDFALA